MKISVCVVTYNRSENIDRIIRSLKKQRVSPHQLVIVDDSDGNETQKIISRFDSQTNVSTEYIHRSTSSGMTEARNVAIDYVDGDIVAFLDDDVECPPEWIANLRNSWRSHPNAHAIGGPALLVDSDGEYVHDITHTDENLNWINKYGEQRSSQGAWVPSSYIEVDQLGGANMSFRKNVLDDLGGFNAFYQGSEVYEDTDIMARIRRRDGKIIYHPDLAIKHYETAKVGAPTDKEAQYWFGFNAILFRYICYPENFSISIIRLLTINQGWLLPAWLKFLSALIKNTDWLFVLKGYIDGLIYVIRNRKSLTADYSPDNLESM